VERIDAEHLTLRIADTRGMKVKRKNEVLVVEDARSLGFQQCNHPNDHVL
jgi:hypothetical protein